MEYDEIIHRCFRCGHCKFTRDYTTFNCPSYRKFRFETYSPGGRMWLFRAFLNKDIPGSQRLAEIFYSCASCGNCTVNCVMEFRPLLVEIFNEARYKLVEEGFTPPPVRDYFKNMQIAGNPYKLPKEARAEWAEGMEIKPYKDQEYLFYVGDVGSFDEKAREMTRSVASVLKNADIDFGILGPDEICDGNDVRVMGESGLFELFVQENISMFQDKNITRIIALSPHSYNVFKNEYPKYGGNFEVFHYTQLLAELVRAGRISFSHFSARVTYQDPCYLGRHNLEFEAPRLLLNEIPGIVLREMENTMKNSSCCGGGGGNIFTDILGGGPESPSRLRVKEAQETGAEVLVVACPSCARMLDDAIKIEGIEDRLEVVDIAELMEKAGIECR